MAIEWIKRLENLLSSVTSIPNPIFHNQKDSFVSTVSGYRSKRNSTLNKWDKAHMKTAENYALLSSAKRAQVGCVLVKDNRIISIGYNGMPSGWSNKCETTDEYGNMPKTKPEVLHAETNAIAKVAKSSESAEGATLYTTCAPCLDCAKLIYQSGISRVVYGHTYRKKEGLTFLEKCDILLEQLEI
jgi:dCMP deaminase